MFELPQIPTVRLTPGQELKLAKPATDLYVGQVLKTVVIKALDDNQVLININGQNINAKTSHHFTPGELLQVKVLANDNEAILQVIPELKNNNVLQSALLQTLPKQAPATELLSLLHYLQSKDDLPMPLRQQIHQLINSIIPLNRLPQHITQAIAQSGLFWEAALANWKKDQPSQNIARDFKGQCMKLLGMLNPSLKDTFMALPENNNKTLPLPGAVPQPLHKPILNLPKDMDLNSLQSILYKHVTQVLSRITSNQLIHIHQSDQQPYQLMLDLPVQTPQGLEVIPLLIQNKKAQPMQSSQWSVTFAVSLDHLGDIQATVSLSQNDLDIRINTEEKMTLNLINDHKKDLENILEQAGLRLRNWTVQEGLEDNHIDTKNLRLLDIRI